MKLVRGMEAFDQGISVFGWADIGLVWFERDLFNKTWWLKSS